MPRERPRGRWLPPPERRRRGDVIAIVVIVVVVTAAATGLAVTSPHAHTVSIPAAAPVAYPPPAAAVPSGFVEVWRARSAATPVPVVAGPVAVTGDGGTVAGRDAGTGEVRWTYARDLPLCTVGTGFPDRDGGVALALYRHGDWCSELTSLHPDTGDRDRQRNPDVRPGTRLIEAGSLVAATGERYLEVFRSDLVRTVEYGQVATPRQLARQPRSTCAAAGFAATTGRLAVLQRCPEEDVERLSVIDPDGAEADKPQEEFSVPLTASGATLVAVSDDRVAVALPDPPRLQVLDRAGGPVATVGLDVPAGDLARPPAGGVAAVTAGGTVTGDGDRLYWWTGSRTVALDPLDLTPLWTLPDTLGPGAEYAGSLLVPVPDGLAVVDGTSGTVTRTLPLPRPDRTPVASTVLGDVLLEQRGPELVALRPTP